MSGWLDQLDAAGQPELLGSLMSSVSEDCFCNPWYAGTEYIVPALCKRATDLNQPQSWGFGELGPGLATLITEIADKLGHWANRNVSGAYVRFDPWPTPQKYQAALGQWPKESKADG